MIVGLGIDVVDTRRVRRELTYRAWTPEDGIFTPDEINFACRGRDPAERYGACFAAKEAALKALGMQVENLSYFREVELLPSLSETSFSLLLKGHAESVSRSLNVSRVLVSVTMSPNVSSAMVLLET